MELGAVLDFHSEPGTMAQCQGASIPAGGSWESHKFKSESSVGTNMNE